MLVRHAGLTVIALLALVLAPTGWSALEQIDDSTWRDDFEGDTLDGWGLPDYYRLSEVDGNGVLEVGGEGIPSEQVKLAYPGVGPTLTNYAVECRVRQMTGSWAGLYFRKSEAGHFEAFVYGQRMLIRRQPGAVVLSLAPLPETEDGWHTLRITGVDSTIRVYVDGSLQFSCSDEELTSGTCGIASHQTHAFYDDFVISTDLRPEETLFVRPDAPVEGLVVPPDAPARIDLSVWNASDATRDVEIGWALDEGATTEVPVALQPDERRLLPLDLGVLQEGIHWIELAVSEGGRQYEGGQFPLAAVTPPDAEFEEPFLAFGAYDKYQLGGEEWALNTYLHAMCNDMRKHGLNTIMAGNAMPKPTTRQLDILARYGVKVILRGMGELPREVTTHPAVLAIAFGDEPTVDDLASYRARFEELAEKTAAPITTCLIGESAGTRSPADPWLIWPELGSNFKLARYYPIRKSVYDLVRYPAYKLNYPPHATLRLIEVAAGEGGWYYVIQGFGEPVSEETPEPYWRNPDAAEMRGMAHLALAHGARGVISYPYQTERANWPALVDQRWLQPTDGKYEALAEVARQVAPVRETLLASKWAAIEVRATPLTVEAVGRETEDGRRLVYLVNRDTDAPADARIEIMDPVVDSNRVPIAWTRELFSATDVPFEPMDMSSTLALQLKPGGGALLEFGVQ